MKERKSPSRTGSTGRRLSLTGRRRLPLTDGGGELERGLQVGQSVEGDERERCEKKKTWIRDTTVSLRRNCRSCGGGNRKSWIQPEQTAEKLACIPRKSFGENVSNHAQ